MRENLIAGHISNFGIQSAQDLYRSQADPVPESEQTFENLIRGKYS